MTEIQTRPSHLQLKSFLEWSVDPELDPEQFLQSDKSFTQEIRTRSETSSLVDTLTTPQLHDQ